MMTLAKEKGAVPVTRRENEIKTLKDENDALKKEVTKLGQELARATAGGAEGASGGKRKRTESTDRSMEEALPRLPTEVWAEVAVKIHNDDVMAFASTSKQLREAQQQAGRKLVTRPFWEKTDDNGDVEAFGCNFFTRDWCNWWSRRFNMTETASDCMNRVIKVTWRY